MNIRLKDNLWITGISALRKNGKIIYHFTFSCQRFPYNEKLVGTDLHVSWSNRSFYIPYNYTSYNDYCLIHHSLHVQLGSLRPFLKKIFKLINPRHIQKLKKQVSHWKNVSSIKEWYEVIPAKDAVEIDKYLRSLELPCSDNFRAANIKKSSQIRRYKRNKDRGCCGFYDEIITVNGTKYLVGLNYGH